MNNEKRDTVQNTAEILLRRALELHPYRTLDPNEASLFVVAPFSVTSWKVESIAAAQWMNYVNDNLDPQRLATVSSCAGRTHRQRMHDVATHLRKSPWCDTALARTTIVQVTDADQSHSHHNLLYLQVPAFTRSRSPRYLSIP